MATYELFKDGQFLLASKLNRLVPQMITQGTDLEFVGASNTTAVATDIVFLPDTDAIYNYELFFCYSASTDVDVTWYWQADEATFSRYALYRAPGSSGSLTTGAAAIMRRPAQTTAVECQGGDPDGTIEPVNFMIAYDRGTFTTTSTSGAIGLMAAAAGLDDDASPNEEKTIIRGGNGTRLLITRVG